jgi:hypothetical protein
VTWWRIEIRAAVVEPVGQKAYCSARRISIGGSVNVGYKNRCTSSLSTSLERTEVTEIGLKSVGTTGCVTLATGWMIAVFH